jgi:energy-converting hydrogenase Eha subunit H
MFFFHIFSLIPIQNLSIVQGFSYIFPLKSLFFIEIMEILAKLPMFPKPPALDTAAASSGPAAPA